MDHPNGRQPEDVASRFADLVDAFVGDERVTLPGTKPGFGSSGLRVGGRIFAMVSSREQFVVKLPAARVSALIASGDGEHYDPGHGRVLKEWLAVRSSSEVDWLALAHEAFHFVRGDSGRI